MGKFTVQQIRAAYKYNLKAGNGQIVATSPLFFSMEQCVEAIHWVCAHCGAPVEDSTMGENLGAQIKYQIYFNDKGGICFRLLDEKGSVFLLAEGYTAKRSCKMGIQSVRNNAPDAPIII